MPLSDYEQSVIDDLERSLLRDDPKLAQAFRTSPSHPYTRVIGVAVGLLLGIAMIILGSIMGQALIVALGFAVIFLSLTVVASNRRATRQPADENKYDYVSLSPKELATSNTSDSSGRFMDRLEDRWNRRQSELG